MVELTPEATRRVWEIWGPMARWSETELGRYTDAELNFVLEFLQRGRAFVEDYVVKLRERSPLPRTAPGRPTRRK
jgi:hypothetical protein